MGLDIACHLLLQRALLSQLRTKKTMSFTRKSLSRKPQMIITESWLTPTHLVLVTNRTSLPTFSYHILWVSLSVLATFLIAVIKY